MFLNEFEHKLCYITLKTEKINGSFFLYKVGKSQPTAFKARHYTQPFKTWWEWEQNDILHQSLTWLSHGYPFEHTKVDRNYSQVLFKILNRNVKQKQPGKRSKNGLLPQQKWLCLMIWVRIYPFQELIHSKNWSILAPFDPFSEIINLWQFSFQIIFSEKHAPNSILKRGKYKGRDIFMYIINSTGIIETSAESRKKLALRTVLNNTTHYSLIFIPSDSFRFLATW